jgi:hypothetical protein
MYTLHTLPSFSIAPNPTQTEDLDTEVQTQRLENVISLNKDIKRLSKKGREHDPVEHWLGQHNRKFEILRTFTSLVSALTSSIVLLKVFGLI